MILLETKNLEKYFRGVRAVSGVSLTFERGTITSLIGPNGSGKTTLLNLLSGFMPFDRGALVVGGESLSHLPPYEAAELGITRTFQEVRLFNQMTVLDNILVVLTARGVLAALRESHQKYHAEQAKVILERVGLWEKHAALASQLSYGQRKLLELARVMAMKCELILLDEPFAGLFPEMVKAVTALIMELKAEGNTIILVEHNMDLVRQLSDQIYVLDSGELLAAGEPVEVLSRAAVVEAYLGK